MKKIFTLFALAMATLTASATDYSDNLKVTLGGITSEQPATISVEELSDGNYTLTLKDFSLNIGGQSLDVGNIVISGAKAVQKDGIKGFALAQAVNIAAGSDNSKSWIGPSLGEVPLKLSAEFTSDKLFTVIKIAMNGMSIDVQFGNRFSEAFYQAQNSNFEEFVGSGKTLEPKYWHSFGSASGSFAGFVNGTQKVFQSPDVRPGSTGSSSVKIISTSTWGTIANGNLTTGRVMAGGMLAGSTANNNTSDPTSANLDQSGAPFVQPFFGRPDSMVVWVKFVPGNNAPADAKASIRATIHDNTKYQNPEDKTYTNTVATAIALSPKTNGEWVRLSAPFSYTENDVVPANILFSISTNETPGKGSSSDELYIDDIELVYKNAPLVTSVNKVSVISATSSSEKGIYSLDGRRVSSPKAGGLYIIKEAGKPARKVRY